MLKKSCNGTDIETNDPKGRKTSRDDSCRITVFGHLWKRDRARRRGLFGTGTSAACRSVVECGLKAKVSLPSKTKGTGLSRKLFYKRFPLRVSR